VTTLDQVVGLGAWVIPQLRRCLWNRKTRPAPLKLARRHPRSNSYKVCKCLRFFLLIVNFTFLTPSFSPQNLVHFHVTQDSASGPIFFCLLHLSSDSLPLMVCLDYALRAHHLSSSALAGANQGVVNLIADQGAARPAIRDQGIHS
jgi:hypothetical protein